MTKVDVNTATREELIESAGIRPDIADDILKLRRRRGRFDNLNVLDGLYGVGPATFEQFRRVLKVNHKTPHVNKKTEDKNGNHLTTLLVSLIGIICLFTLAIYLGTNIDSSIPNAGHDLKLMLLSMLVAGSVGGMIFGIRKNNGFILLIWKDEERLDLGFLIDIAQGATGSVIIFLLIPVEIKDPLDNTAAIKLLALSLLGGYAGPPLIQMALDKTFAGIAENIDRVEKKVEQLTKQLNPNDITALEMAAKRLTAERVGQDFESKMRDAIKSASERARLLIFLRAHDVRHGSWNNKQWKNMERVIPIFRALTEPNVSDQRHIYYGELEYALKDKKPPDWPGALEAFDKAIHMREETK